MIVRPSHEGLKIVRFGKEQVEESVSVRKVIALNELTSEWIRQLSNLIAKRYWESANRIPRVKDAFLSQDKIVLLE